MPTISLVSLPFVAHVSSVSVRKSTIGSSFGSIVFLVAFVSGQLPDQLFKRVSTISSREVIGHQCYKIKWSADQVLIIFWSSTVHKMIIRPGEQCGFCLVTFSAALCCTLSQFFNPEFSGRFWSPKKVRKQCRCLNSSIQTSTSPCNAFAYQNSTSGWELTSFMF